MRCPLAAALVILGSASGHADDQLPSLTTLDRQGGASGVSADLTYVSVGDGLTGVRGELYGELFEPTYSLGMYARVPYSQITSGGMGASPEWSGTALGDVELGGEWRVPRGEGFFGIVHAAIALPTAPRDGYGLYANDYTIPARIQDVALALPDATTLRFGISPIAIAKPVIVRVDAGVDINVSNERGTPMGGWRSADIRSITHFDIGVGYAIRSVLVSGELTSVRVDGAEDLVTPNGAGIGRMVNASVAVRARFGAWSPYIALVVPLIGTINDNPANTGHFVACAGVSLAL